MQQVSTSVQDVSGLSQKTVNILLENFKVSGEQPPSRSFAGKPHKIARNGNYRAY
jgi:methyl-accepting chemotaxis protein